MAVYFKPIYKESLTMKFLKYFNSAMRVITIILEWSKAIQDREVTADEGFDLVKK